MLLESHALSPDQNRVPFKAEYGNSAMPLALDGLGILIAEDDLRLALRIEQAVMDAGGFVVGPAPTVSDALRLINIERVDGAIVDIILHRQVATPIAERLRDEGIPFVFHADVKLPDALKLHFPEAPVCLKPMSPDALVGAFAEYLAKKRADADQEASSLALLAGGLMAAC